MGIEPDKIFKVIDSDWENIESEFTKATEIIMPHVEILLENTWTCNKRGTKGILWKNLKEIALSLVDKGIIEVNYRNGIPVVNVDKLESIEIYLGVETLA